MHLEEFVFTSKVSNDHMIARNEFEQVFRWNSRANLVANCRCHRRRCNRNARTGMKRMQFDALPDTLRCAFFENICEGKRCCQKVRVRCRKSREKDNAFGKGLFERFVEYSMRSVRQTGQEIKHVKHTFPINLSRSISAIANATSRT